jgi:hypothetical protein
MNTKSLYETKGPLITLELTSGNARHIINVNNALYYEAKAKAEKQNLEFDELVQNAIELYLEYFNADIKGCSVFQ